MKKVCVFLVVFALATSSFAVGDVYGRIIPEKKPPKEEVCKYQQGDFNLDGSLNIKDVMEMIEYLFKGGDAPKSEFIADCDGDFKVTVSDVLWLYGYLFEGGPKPKCGSV